MPGSKPLEIWKILIDQQYGIGTVGQSPALMGVRLVTNKLGNIPIATVSPSTAGRRAAPSRDLVLQGVDPHPRIPVAGR